MPRVRKLATAPPKIVSALHEEFVRRGFGDIEGITAWLNDELAKAGLPLRVGKSAVGEESLRVRRAQEAIAATTRSMQLIADTAKDDADKRGEALNAMVSHGLFETLLLAQEADGEKDPAKRIALLNKAALASARLTTTSVRQRQWRAEVEKRAQAAAEAVSKIASSGGLKSHQVAEIRSQILGISAQAATAAEPAAPVSATT